VFGRALVRTECGTMRAVQEPDAGGGLELKIPSFQARAGSIPTSGTNSTSDLRSDLSSRSVTPDELRDTLLHDVLSVRFSGRLSG